MRIAVAALLFVVAGCDTRVTDVGSYGSQNAAGSSPSSLIGRWAFTRSFGSADGALHLSTTVWQFTAAGSAVRTVYADNITAGISDAVVTSGVWTADARTVSIRLDGSTVPTVFDYRFEGGALILGGLSFARLSP